MRVLITGSSGLIGTALREALTARGDMVYPLLRTPAAHVAFRWQPAQNKIFLDDTKPIDAVVHLAGASLTGNRWDIKGKQRIRDSRVQGTRLLSKQLATLRVPPHVFISASAIGFYGDTGAQEVTEQSPAGQGFLAGVCQEWEKATAAAEAAGIRTIHIRTGLVLSPEGGILPQIIRPFKFGLGGKIGDGNQYMSWISMNDLIQVILFLIEQSALHGPFNLVAPHPVTNRVFTKTLAQVLGRPCFLTVPAWAMRLIGGEKAEALLLFSSRVIPARLTGVGYDFQDQELAAVLNSFFRN